MGEVVIERHPERIGAAAETLEAFRPSSALRRLRFAFVKTTRAEADTATLAALAALVGGPTVALRFERNDELADALAAGDVDLAWITPVGFAHAARRGAARGLCAAVRAGASAYAAVLIGHDERCPGLDTLAGRRVGWVDPWSAAGYLAPRRMLARRGLDPDALFSEQVFLGEYAAIVEALRAGRIDVGPALGQLDAAGHLVGHALEAEPWAVVLGASEPIPADVICAGPRVDAVTVDRLRARLCAARFDPGHPLAALTGATGFEPFDESRYVGLREALERS